MEAPISEICIVGGGPAGLAAAIAVTQSGYRATVIDHAVPPIEKACGEGLMPDSIAVLNRLGVNLPSDVGHPFKGIRFSDVHSSVAADFPIGLGVGIRRTVLHQLLLDRADQIGVNCIWGARKIQFAGPYISVDGVGLKPDLIVAADGQNSVARRAYGLHRIVRERRRYGFRRHYRMAPWSQYMELHWGPKCQIYITPVSKDEVCLVSMSRSPTVRLDDALGYFPALRQRLEMGERACRDMGALSVSRKLHRVCRSNIALIGDASGSVDAITGEGLCLSFKQALALAEALRSGNLARYESKHNSLSRRPRAMGTLMLTLDKHSSFQRKALAGLAGCPGIFASLLAVHVGGGSFSDLFSWPLFRFCRAFMEA